MNRKNESIRDRLRPCFLCHFELYAESDDIRAELRRMNVSEFLFRMTVPVFDAPVKGDNIWIMDSAHKCFINGLVVSRTFLMELDLEEEYRSTVSSMPAEINVKVQITSILK